MLSFRALFHGDLSIKLKDRFHVTEIVMPFDVILFNGDVPQNKHHKIMYCKDLNHLLGQNWHVRGINNGYVDFYQRRNRSLVEYI